MNGSITESVAVRRLRARNAPCRKARGIARVVARDLLQREDVPDTVKGFAIEVEEPCTSCSPITEVKATRGSARVTFKVAGGA